MPPERRVEIARCAPPAIGYSFGVGGRAGKVAAASGPSLPSISGTYLAWYEASVGVTNISGGADVWANQIAGDALKNAAASADFRRPTINSANASLNNKPSLDFDADDILVTGTWASAPAQPLIFAYAGYRGTGGTSFYPFDGLAAGQCNMASISGFASMDSASIFNVPDLGTTAHVGASLYNGATPASKLYNTAITAIATGTTVSTFAGLTIGAQNNTTGVWGGSNGGGSLAELIVVAGSSTADVTTLLNYLGAKYAITIGA